MSIRYRFFLNIVSSPSCSVFFSRGGGRHQFFLTRTGDHVGIFEWDGHDGVWHKDLPSFDERRHYFPRLDTTYESFFIPTMPGKYIGWRLALNNLVLHTHAQKIRTKVGVYG